MGENFGKSYIWLSDQYPKTEKLQLNNNNNRNTTELKKKPIYPIPISKKYRSLWNGAEFHWLLAQL